MSAPAAVAEPDQYELPIEIDHCTWLHGVRFTCIQPNCDREHHVWCSCER